MAFDSSKLTDDDFDSVFGVDNTPSVVEEAFKSDPAQQARVNTLSRDTGAPAFAIEADVEGIEQSQRLSDVDFEKIRAETPVTHRYLGQYNKATVMQNDITLMSMLENTVKSVRDAVPFVDTISEVRPSKITEGLSTTIGLNFREQAKGASLAAVDAGPRRIADLVPMSAMPMGFEADAAFLSEEVAENLGIESDEQLQTLQEEQVQTLIGEVREIAAQRDDITPDDLSTIEQGVRGGLESLAQMAPGFAAMVATGGKATPLLVSMAGQSFTGSYADARAEGLTVNQARAKAGIDAVIEVGTEVLPTGTLSRMLTGGNKSDLTKNAMKFMVQEMGTEQLATLGQSFNDYMFDLDEQMENATSAAEMVDIQMQRQAVTAIATLVAGGAQTGAVAVINKTIATVTGADQQQQIRADVEQTAIDQLNANATNAEVRSLDPETFREFMQDISEDENVFISGTAVRDYLATRTRGEIETDPALVAMADQVEEAAALDGDVVIPVADFATDFAGTDHFTALRPNMKMSDQTFTPAEADQVQETNTQHLESLVAEAEKSASEYLEAQDIFETVKSQLIDTGQLSPKDAGTIAQIVPAWATVYAKKNGLTVAEAFELGGLSITGPQTGERARLDAEEALLSQEQLSLEFGDDIVGFEGGTRGEAVQWVVAKQKGLDLSEPARRARAAEQGFDVESVAFRGGNVDLRVTDVDARSGKTEGTGVFLSSSSEVANSYAGRPDGNVTQTYVKKDNHLSLDAEGRNWNDIAADTVITLPDGTQESLSDLMDIPPDETVSTDDIMRFAREAGYSTASIDDVVDIGGFARGVDASKLGPSTVTGVFDPSKLRSVNAAFDPDFVESADLLAQEVISSADQAAQAKNAKGLEELGLTETERQVNFEDWFDGSVVVNPDGSPRVMYHGTGNIDSIFGGGFDPEITGQGMDQAGSGFYFTTDSVEARGYETALTQNIQGAEQKLGGDVSPGTVEVYLAVKNPIVIPGTNLNDADVDLTEEQVVQILQHSEIAKSEEDSPFGDFYEEYWEGGTQDWMYEAVASNYTGASLMSLEGDFFDGEATNFRTAVRDALGFDGVVQEFDGGKRHVVAWFPEQIKSVYNIGTFDPADPDIFKQNGSRVRGTYNPATSVINMTEASDLSTFLHEFAHFALEMERQAGGDTLQSINNWNKRNAAAVAAEANETPEGGKLQIGVNEQDVEDYVDFGTTGDSQKDAALNRAVHEQFARGFETYLMEGKAPSIELRNAFRTFARWLSEIYARIKGDLKVSLDSEMRQVLDRMLATEEQIAAAEARAKFEPMFTDAAAAGMTEKEFTDYQKRQEKVKDVQSETLRDKLIKEFTREQTKVWRDEKRDIVDEEIEQLKTERVYVAREKLRSGEMKLDRAVVKELTGEEKTDKLGRKSIRIPGMLSGMTAPSSDGLHPDVAAGALGYGSGAEMLDDLINAAPIREVAETNAETRMREIHGDILNDGTIERLADEAVVNEERGKLLLRELKILTRGTNQAAVDRQAIQSLAEETIGKMAYRDIHPGKYRRAEIKAARESERMLAEGNRDGAAVAKTRQVMNYYLGMEATKARNETLKIVDRMGRYNKKNVQTAILRAENGYWDQIVKILQRFEFRKAATLKQVDKQNEAVAVWAAERIDTDGDGLILTDEVLNELYTRHWKTVPFNALKGINDSVANIEYVARYGNKIRLREEEIDFKKLVNEWVASMDAKAEDRFKPQRTDVVEGRKFGRWAMAQMTKIPFMASWLDGGERAGMSHDLLVQPLTDAYDAEVRLWEEIGSVVMDAIVGRSKEDIARHNTKLFIPEIQDANNDGNIMGHQVLAVALNTGNESNLRKMLLGEGWADPDVDATISFDNPQLQAVLKNMTKSDWELVQLIWKQMDLLYPQLAEVHRKTTGLTPPKVEATPRTVTVNGDEIELEGGYYPVKYDPNRDARAEENQNKLDAETESMFSSMSLQAQVNAGATNERTGYYAPIRLSLDVVPNHMQETIHYITHHEAVRQINKLIRNKSVGSTIRAKLGPEEFGQLKPWLNDVAKDGREAPTKTFWGAALQKLRFGTTLGIMGFKASTGIIQISGLSNTIAELGMGPVMQSLRSILGSPDTMQKAWEFASENSKVMNHRAQTMDREIKNAMQKIEGKRGIKAAVQEASMKHIALIQTYMVDLPSWHAAYISSMKEHGDEARAFKHADWVVENVQGSGAMKDMAQIMRNQSEESRMFTMFMTFFSSLWNLERDLVKGARSGVYSKTTVAAKMMFLFAIPVLFEMIMRGDMGEPEDGEDDRLQSYLTNLALYPVQSVPFVRDIASGVSGDFGYNMSPIAQLLETSVQTVPELLKRPFTDEEITKGQVKGATKFIGAAAGVPGVNQAWATGEHLHDVMVEGEEFTTHQLLFGPKKD